MDGSHSMSAMPREQAEAKPSGQSALLKERSYQIHLQSKHWVLMRASENEADTFLLQTDNLPGPVQAPNTSRKISSQVSYHGLTCVAPSQPALSI